jgi:hypothetical protein
MKLYHLFYSESDSDDAPLSQDSEPLLLGTYSSAKKRKEARKRYHKGGTWTENADDGIDTCQFVETEEKLDKDNLRG